MSIQQVLHKKFSRKKHLLFLTGIITLVGCSIFSGNNNYPTIPLPPQKTNASDAATPVIPNPAQTKNNASKPQASAIGSNVPTSHTKVIKEERSNGQVTQIKVENGNALPDYYMYPSQQQNLNTNSTPDKNLSTPSWQISW